MQEEEEEEGRLISFSRNSMALRCFFKNC